MSDINASTEFKNDTQKAAERVLGRDPLPIIRWLNMALGLALLVFGVLGFIKTIGGLFSFKTNVIMNFFFNLYQL